MSEIDALETFTVRMRRREPFVIATGSSDTVENVLVRITSGEREGWGACAPNTVTGDDLDRVMGSLRRAEKLLGEDIRDPEELHRSLEGIGATPRSALDAAFYDLWAKERGVQVCDMLGRIRDSIPTSVTIGIMPLEETVERARSLVREGFKALKLKVGMDLGSDIERVRGVREAVGETVIRVDCNQGYDLDQSRDFLQAVDPLGLELVEQPLPADLLAEMGELAEGSPVPIMADEAVHGTEDLSSLPPSIELINIKLAKCGGIHRAVEMARLCHRRGLRAMVGCMSECQASIAAGLHFALSSPAVACADLDSHLSLMDDPTTALLTKGGRLFPTGTAGLGITINDRNRIMGTDRTGR
ncbi:MAG: mandelate racemase/muconate lactonizing enzyme family protein [Methanomassiliicoccales archaeon]